jgi:shikimate kinase
MQAIPEGQAASKAALQTGLHRVVLTGFMGAGKSTVGRLLARQLQWRFVDSDAEIEATTGLSVPEIFRQHGEPRFRELEHDAIRRLLGSERLVLALGGGAIEDERSRELLFQDAHTCVVHLEASMETVLRRCAGSDAFRPVLADRNNLSLRYERRLPLYRQSHLTIGVDHLTPFDVVQAIRARVLLSPESSIQA